ncbi:MAG TPA: rhomboid family intramembrane serine protease [Candidatus Alistipes excrementipullorum]|nr:rhomboid family intramembrane serine protease [Candidatus Alistipes excrementipullorum]
MNPYFRTPPVVKNLIIANTLIFLATWLLPQAAIIADRFFALYWFGSPLFHSYQYITYMFLHGGFGHLFFNMFALWMFGRTLEYELGSRRFIIYYLVCGVGAALIQMLVAWLTGDLGIVLIGASGAVMGVLLAFGVMHPNEVLIMFPIPVPVKAKWFVIGYAALELFYGATGRAAGIAHFAHVGGMLWGYLLLLYWKRKGAIRY